MSFLYPKDLILNNLYKLTEFVENKEISTGRYYLVSINSQSRDFNYPVLGFSITKSGKPSVFLMEAHPQFADPTWRRAFGNGKSWQAYWPIGASTWNHSWVTITLEDTEWQWKQFSGKKKIA